MADAREEILERILELAKTITPTAKRMDFQVDPDDMPCLVVSDGREEAWGNRPPHHPGMAAHFQQMTVQLVLFAQGSDAMGTAINQTRAATIRTLCGDATLASITGHPSGCRYEGCETGVELGEGILADMSLSFSLVYVLKPSEL